MQPGCCGIYSQYTVGSVVRTLVYAMSAHVRVRGSLTMALYVHDYIITMSCCFVFSAIRNISTWNMGTIAGCRRSGVDPTLAYLWLSTACLLAYSGFLRFDELIHVYILLVIVVLGCTKFCAIII